MSDSNSPQDPSRRNLATGVAALALAGVIAAGNAAAHEPQPVALPRGPGKKPANFSFRVGGSPESVGVSASRLKRIHPMLQAHIDAGRISGAVTAIARRGQLVHFESHGYANAADKTAMPSDAIFRMASSSKPVASVALLMMIEEGRVRLHDPVSRFIPEFKDTKVAILRPGEPQRRAPNAPPRKVDVVSADRPVTVLDLATHTSGLLSGGAGGDVLNPRRGPDDTLATYIPKLGAVPLDYQPGTKWAYSGGAGPDTISRIVEIVSGQDFETFTRERIFAPLGMNDTYFNVPAAKKQRLLAQQRRVNGQWQVTPNPEAPPTKYFSGAGGLQSTCHDYLVFEQMLANRGELNGKRLLGTRTVELMGANQVGNLFDGPIHDLPGHGFGIIVRSVTESAISQTGRANGSFGWQGAFGTMSWNDRAEELAAVIMLQQTDLEVHHDFEKLVRQTIVD